MKPAPRYLGHAGEQLAVKRLAGFRRIAELVAEQEAALEADDLERFEELSEEIGGLRAELGRLGPVEDPRSPEAEQIADALRSAVEGTRRVQDRLASMRSERAGDIRKVRKSQPRARTYMTSDEGSPPPASGLDVRF